MNVLVLSACREAPEKTEVLYAAEDKQYKQYNICIYVHICVCIYIYICMHVLCIYIYIYIYIMVK